MELTILCKEERYVLSEPCNDLLRGKKKRLSSHTKPKPEIREGSDWKELKTTNLKMLCHVSN